VGFCTTLNGLACILLLLWVVSPDLCTVKFPHALIPLELRSIFRVGEYTQGDNPGPSGSRAAEGYSHLPSHNIQILALTLLIWETPFVLGLAYVSFGLVT
jgi:hypothetical protein